VPDAAPTAPTPLGFDDLESLVRRDLGTSGWVTVGQERIDAFADATGDDQWIHVDPERARSGPFGGAIAHGYLSLSLIPSLLRGIYRIEGASHGINYGLNRVRFPAPVPAGSRVRATAHLLTVERRTDGSLATVRVTIEIEGADRPACVAEVLSLLVPAAQG
jgi:acyl dehydratase